MKRSFRHLATVPFLLLASILTASTALADQIFLPERVFAPVGFDTNDNSEVVLYGHFPDSCYTAGLAKVEVRGRDILVRNYALHWQSGTCLKALVPWTTTVNLGALASGNYTVRVQDSEGRMQRFTEINILPSLTRRADDFPYAYVNGAIVNRTKDGVSLVMSGTFSLTCMEIAETRLRETNGVLVVLPILRLRSDVPCGHPFAPIPFTRQMSIRENSGNAVLIHIRSMNGQSLNQVMDF
ncbi:MAG: hypothetical protein H7301_00945 [Cryobacterium sp.]|nr:hypothetical protein [Oligoflexia bacterium]